MMKRIYIMMIAALTMLVMGGCSDDLSSDFVKEGQLVDLIIPFGSEDNFKVDISSRATLPEDREKKIYNFYIYIFDAKGNKVYGHYFDSANLNQTSQSNYWTAATDFASGSIRIKTYSANSCMVYALTNIDSDMVNVSPEKLNMIQNENDIKELVSTMNQNTVARNGYFPMSAQIGPINIGQNAGPHPTLMFKRMDAKILFNFYVGDPAPGKQKIEEFVPRSWQVMNVPRSAYVFQQADASAKLKDYFNTEAVNFEGKAITNKVTGHNGQRSDVTTHLFSFYMQENKTETRGGATPENQADRSRRVKNANGTNGDWMYADARATYVLVRGRISMNNPLPTDPSDKTTVGNTLNADVTYIIHLGDFKTNMADYNVMRNTQYTYNVMIRGVDDIRIEVETNKNTEPTENAPGAFGDVTVAKEEIYECDAHYSSHVLTFHAQNIKPEKVTWYVKTPFCEGKPNQLDGYDVPTGLDYKWVHFQLNEIDPSNNQYYMQKRKKYDPNNCMDVIELVAFLRKEATEWHNDPSSPNHHFDKTPEQEGGPKICVTAHVDEYYYEVNPITGVYEKNLARKVVNQPMRLMHILSDTEVSKDKESQIVGSSSTIQQRSIQTIYNMNNPNLHSGWGCEYWDEYPKNYNERWDYGNPESSSFRGNTDPYNGRVNTCKEWGLCNPDGTFNTSTPKKWDTFMNFEVENSIPLLNPAYRNLRYSCMSRNRDNNGNGIIDEDEVRWYMASVRQLIGIWMGADGISNDARLYTKEGVGAGNGWRQHIISSTVYPSDNKDKRNSNNPTIIWAEEGSSTSSYSLSYSMGDRTIYSVRCVRNLGEHEGKDITKAPISVAPTEYIFMEPSKTTKGAYTINMTYLNEKSIRYFTSRELDFSDENSMQNRVYKAFEAAPKNSHPNFSQTGFRGINTQLDNNITQNPYCPPGYRLPNQRELTAMAYYLPYDGSKNNDYWEGCAFAVTRTKFSFGVFGQQKENNKYGWAYSPVQNAIGNIQMAHSDGGSGDASNNKTTQVRCVKDVAQ